MFSLDVTAEALRTEIDIKLAISLQRGQLTFFKRSAILEEKRPFCVFEPTLGDLGTTYDDHLRLIGKCVVDFLLVLIEVFFSSCYSEGATSDYLFKIGDFAPMGVGLPNISGRRGRPPPTFFF